MHATFLEQIWAEPANDEAREVYADWLQTRGDARGEFIVLQLRQARGIAAPREQRRAKQLLAAHRTAWLGEDLAATLTVQRFERGFMTSAKVRRHAVVSDRATLTSPELWFVEQLDGDAHVLELAPAMRSLRTVRASGESTIVTAIERVEPQRWQTVKAGPELTYEHVLVKAVASPAFRRVPHLEVWVWPDSLARLVTLARRFGWPNQTELAKLTLARGAGFATDATALRAQLNDSGARELAREVVSHGMYGTPLSL